MRNVYIIIGLISAVVVGAVIYGFTVVGSPFKRQAMKSDQQRISDLNNISYSIQTYFSTNQKLPEKLTDVSTTSLYTKDSLSDPKTKKPYEYIKITETNYKLCATFELDSSEIKNDYDYGSPFLYFVPTAFAQFSVPTSSKNAHKKGYDCLTYEIPSSYKKSSTLKDTTVPQYTLPNIPFKDVEVLVKTIPSDTTAFTAPAANAIFTKGNRNIIQSKYTITEINLYLIDTNNNLNGRIVVSGTCDRKSTIGCTAYWDAQVVRDINNNLKEVAPGTYKIAMISPYNNPLVLGGVSNQFKIQ